MWVKWQICSRETFDPALPGYHDSVRGCVTNSICLEHHILVLLLIGLLLFLSLFVSISYFSHTLINSNNNIALFKHIITFKRVKSYLISGFDVSQNNIIITGPRSHCTKYAFLNNLDCIVTHCRAEIVSNSYCKVTLEWTTQAKANKKKQRI